MKDKKNKDMGPTLVQKSEEKKDDIREIADKDLDKVSGGTTPIIRPF